MKILRKEIFFSGCGGLHDAFDDVVKSIYNITDEEYDIICEEATEDELDLFLDGLDNPTFTQKRKGLEVRNKYIKYFQK